MRQKEVLMSEVQKNSTSFNNYFKENLLLPISQMNALRKAHSTLVCTLLKPRAVHWPM